MKKVLVIFHPLNEGLKYIENGGTQFAPHHFWGFDQLKMRGYEVDYVQWTPGSGLLNRIGRWFNMHLMDQQLDCWRQSKDYDLIFIPDMDYSFFLSLLKILKLNDKPMVGITYEPYATDKPQFLKRLKQQLIRAIYLKGTDRVVYYNPLVYEQSQQSRIKGPSVFVDHFGVDCNFFEDYTARQKETPLSNYIFSTGGAFRDYSSLIQAFQQIDFKLKITTAGNRKGIEADQLSPNIEVDDTLPFGLGSTGLIRKEYYHALGVAIPLAPVERDNTYGITVLYEAMAMARPVISTDNKAYPFHVEKEKVGLLVDYGDVEGWRQAVNYLKDHPGQAREMGERGAHLVRNKYNYRLFAQGVVDQVDQLLRIGEKTGQSEIPDIGMAG